VKPLYLRIVDVVDETADIRRYVLAGLEDEVLPDAAAGAHIAILLPPNLVRRYSLCALPGDRRSYEIAVKREDAGRGGSRKLHARAAVGRILKALPPRNDFPLRAAGRYLFLSSGIGITPIRAMMAEAADRPHRLIYCVRSREDVPFAGDVRSWVYEGRCRLHLSGSDGRIDLAGALSGREENEELYCCGSSGFMAAVAAATQHWPRGSTHFEAFGTRQSHVGNEPCIVKVAGSAQAFQVASDETILEALRAHGYAVDSVCENGACGACVVRVVSGAPLHRDAVLTAAERERLLTTCVSRSADPAAPLVLELDGARA
jgi:ferredoxin-NADP reductase